MSAREYRGVTIRVADEDGVAKAVAANANAETRTVTQLGWNGWTLCSFTVVEGDDGWFRVAIVYERRADWGR